MARPQERAKAVGHCLAEEPTPEPSSPRSSPQPRRVGASAAA
eukprot:CAMPEP_0180506418 /NCGR_PEP_ID=MMETSP1036_2-20121128/47969_1 /TAXON_ID=632150 /ORGANISM="Azadinium spinosum, Strain 3D9" /LENGTH=41 /DNA_ID= /DNA_START= /DNA_END= /DNA_ORIENTATION=